MEIWPSFFIGHINGNSRTKSRIDHITRPRNYIWYFVRFFSTFCNVSSWFYSFLNLAILSINFPVPGKLRTSWIFPANSDIIGCEVLNFYPSAVAVSLAVRVVSQESLSAAMRSVGPCNVSISNVCCNFEFISSVCFIYSCWNGVLVLVWEQGIGDCGESDGTDSWNFWIVGVVLTRNSKHGTWAKWSGLFSKESVFPIPK